MTSGSATLENGHHDLAIIVVAMNMHWLRPCLRTLLEQIGDGITVDVVVVDNASPDDTAAVVTQEFPEVRAVRSANHGFGHANNRALMTCDARYVLFLNPDTEILDGTFADLVRALDARPEVGLVGVRQVDAEGRLDQTIRYFPHALRALGEALGADRYERRPRWLGERELDPAAYDRESACDWTSGSFMFTRREALDSAGFFDERFFMYSEETDLCRRIKDAGWHVRHLPNMTIRHYGAAPGPDPRIESLGAATRVDYARKHFSPAHRALYAAAVGFRHLLRSLYTGGGAQGRRRRTASRRALATLLGLAPVPFAEITRAVAVAPREDASFPVRAGMRRGPLLSGRAKE